jgi:hypothetical protein
MHESCVFIQWQGLCRGRERMYPVADIGTTALYILSLLSVQMVLSD